MADRNKEYISGLIYFLSWWMFFWGMSYFRGVVTDMDAFCLLSAWLGSLWVSSLFPVINTRVVISAVVFQMITFIFLNLTGKEDFIYLILKLISLGGYIIPLVINMLIKKVAAKKRSSSF